MGKGLVHSENYSVFMNEQVLPYLEARRQNETLKTPDQISLYTSFFTADDCRGTVMLLHGFTENIEKFSEVIYGFLKEGFSVCTLDQRGHGRSYRDPKLKYHYLTHVDHFEDYLNQSVKKRQVPSYHINNEENVTEKREIKWTGDEY